MYKSRLDQYKDLSKRLEGVAIKCKEMISNLNLHTAAKQKRLEQKKMRYQDKNNAKKVAKHRKKHEDEKAIVNETNEETEESDMKEQEQHLDKVVGHKRKMKGKLNYLHLFKEEKNRR